MDDYTKNLNRVSDYPKFYLGQEVNTPNGKGYFNRKNGFIYFRKWI